MAKRPQHQNKEIEKVIKYAESKDWVYSASGSHSHAWGRLLCPMRKREGCSLSVWSTPKCPENHVRQIKKRIDECQHSGENDE